MKILSARQQKMADEHAIAQEPISSLQLMERAAGLCLQAILKQYPGHTRFRIVCGSGNNGGDGLAMARMLLRQGFGDTLCYRIQSAHYSADNEANATRLHSFRPNALLQPQAGQLPEDDENALWIDALFGTGLTRAPEGPAADWINLLNRQHRVVSVDMPSGLYSDGPTPNGQYVRSQHTFTFHAPKQGFFFPAAEVCFSVVDIGLDRDYTESLEGSLHCLDLQTAREIYKPMKRHSHKGHHGHLLLVAGSVDKPGAAVMATKAALRSGCGLVTVFCPEKVAATIALHCPEAMLQTAGADIIGDKPSLPEGSFDAIAVGPGIGTADETAEAINALLMHFREIPLLGDADFINLVAAGKIPAENWQGRSLFTPHPGEFRRMAGSWENDQAMFGMQEAYAANHNIEILLKGAYSCLNSPDGSRWFNPRGHAGMAKGGSGDVLTGLCGGLLAQGYSLKETAQLGMWLHGVAGERAATACSAEAMTAMDLVRYLPDAWKAIEHSTR
jgi:NAD(P)H-hydrate epimerase